MKKSLIITTALVLVVALGIFVGCSNIAPQSQLELPWNNYSETATYIVSGPDDQGVLGELTATYQQFNEVNLDIFASHVDGGKIKYDKITPAFKEANFYGLVMTSKLTLTDGQYKDSIVVLDKQSRVKYSYSNSHFLDPDDNTKYQDIEVMYDYTTMDSKRNVTMKYEVKGAIEKSGEQKLKPFEQIAYFDNAYYIAITRTFRYATQPGQVSFLTHSFREDKMLRRVAGNTARPFEVELHKDSTISLDKFEYPKKEEPKEEEGAEPKPEEPKKTVTCSVANIASAETMPGSGTPIVYYIAAVPYKYNDTIKADKLLVKFIEHGITYDLKSIELA